MGQTSSSEGAGVDPAALLANVPDADAELLAAIADAPEPQRQRGWFKRRSTAADPPQGTQRTTWARRLAHITAEVEGDIQPLVRTPSAERDLEAARTRNPHMPRSVAHRQAARAQRLRAQLRLLDTEIAEAKAELLRRKTLRGPSGARYECDGDCVVGGCGESFAEEEGVLCDCKLFLCHPCFGATVIVNECQIGGRYDTDLSVDVQRHGQAVTAVSQPGSLPCPLFPQSCASGHIPLSTITTAMLHRGNRGRDGDEEDIDSIGISPHRVHLLARREFRWSRSDDVSRDFGHVLTVFFLLCRPLERGTGGRQRCCKRRRRRRVGG